MQGLRRRRRTERRRPQRKRRLLLLHPSSVRHAWGRVDGPVSATARMHAEPPRRVGDDVANHRGLAAIALGSSAMSGLIGPLEARTGSGGVSSAGAQRREAGR